MTNSLFYQLQFNLQNFIFLSRKICSLTKKKNKVSCLEIAAHNERDIIFLVGLITVSNLHKQIAITRVKRDTSVHFEWENVRSFTSVIINSVGQTEKQGDPAQPLPLYLPRSTKTEMIFKGETIATLIGVLA